jgi:hypothetical protein
MMNSQDAQALALTEGDLIRVNHESAKLACLWNCVMTLCKG